MSSIGLFGVVRERLPRHNEESYCSLTATKPGPPEAGREEHVRIRSIVLILALATSVLAVGSLGASAAESNRVTSISGGRFTFSSWFDKCSNIFGPAFTAASGVAKGPVFDKFSDDDDDANGTGTFSFLSGGKVLATLAIPLTYSVYEQPARTARVRYDSDDNCSTVTKLLAAGVGSKVATYTLRLDKATVFTPAKVKYTLAGGPTTTLNFKQMQRAVATSRTPSGGNYTWKGKITLRKKTDTGYAWVAAPKGIAYEYSEDICKASKKGTSTTAGKFSFTGKKATGGYAVIYVNPTKTRGASVSLAAVKSGKVVNLPLYGGC